jgi:hypothetical protein
MTCRSFAGSLLLIAALLPAGAARAQTYAPNPQELETARTLYKEGKELRARGDVRGALEKLQAAHALGNTPVTGIELARTYVMVGQIVEARETCLYIARIPVASDETGKSAEARKDAAELAEELRPRIPALLVKVEGLQPREAARLLIDDVAVPAAATSEPQKVDPGRHEVIARAGEGPTARQARAAAEVKEGETREVTVTLPPPPAPGAPPPEGQKKEEPANAASSGDMPVLAKVGFATAIGGAVVSLIAGTTALSKKGQVSSECNADRTCPAGSQGARDLQTAESWATAANVSIAVAGAAALVGVIGLVTGSRASPPSSGSRGSAPPSVSGVSASPWIGVGMAGLHGTF